MIDERKTITVWPSQQSAIYWDNYPVITTDDSVGGQYRMAMHESGNLQELWLREIALRHPHSCTLVDVGSNVGLFTRQALIAVPTIAKTYIYEPDEQNFYHLQQNLMPWSGSIECFNVALSDALGSADFFHDRDNCGNYSLLRSAMPGVSVFSLASFSPASSFSATKVSTVNALVESCRWLSDDRPILYKSDVQGYDEAIATMVEPKIWDLVFAAILEIWRIPKPTYDVAAFRNILEKFPNRRFLRNDFDLNLTVDEIIEFASGTDGTWLDLVISK